ncbi:metallo-beta-lactamase family protein [Hathewaya proteolytica DSM 3090]|uniref:Metallo-beta-lactamase family protein n=1 Tax=Hathewaya proteolytica DSM 3090 TaxID=1121331 RepID=A0A1M6LDI7_9CLOT|nr:MBL fold metallo-hydrolase [Hathewaya proteolytica]SHJ69145.1 metallo-beta-lactamase family protein [Hathewaya proteolytica DSM 3090]
MKLKFFGAAKTVTGSCHMLIVNGRKVLLDCGLLQGTEDSDVGNANFNFDPKEIEFVILSHAHIDHSGRIPLLYKKGFKGTVISTSATKDLCSVMLPDSGYIHETEVEWKNRKRKRQGLPPIEPLYTSKIAELSTYLFTGYEYDELIDVFPGLKVRFRDAGHLLGAAITEIFVEEKGNKPIKLCYSGDIGNGDSFLIKNPTYVDYADYLIMEATYGDRYHADIKKELYRLADIIQKTVQRGGNIIIPSFSVGRTQDVLYVLNHYIENEILKGIKVYVDSPLAMEATKIFKKHQNLFKDEIQDMILEGDDPLEFQGLDFIKSPGDSASLNKVQSGAIIISASGMCEAGRVRHHLKHNLWRPECSVVFVGYQAEGTLGRSLLEGAEKVKLFGEEIAVNAEIYNLEGMSGHADRAGLYRFLSAFKEKPKEVILVHGDKKSQESFNELLQSNGYNSTIANLGETLFVDEEKIVDYDLRDKLLRTIENFGEINEINKNSVLKLLQEIIHE